MTERHEKTADLAEFKAGAEGEFEAIVSVFGNVDLGGDRVIKGAFAKSLAAWEASGDPIPVLWNHDRSNPQAHIGKVLEAKEVDEGLWIRAALDIHKPFAKQVYDLLAERRVKEFSFAYGIKDAEQNNGAFELKELDVYEVGPTLQGMNPDTQLLAVKSFADAKAGARLSKATTATISEAIDLLASLISVPDEEPKSLEAQTEGAPPGQADGAVSDQDADLITRLNLLKET